MAVPLSLISRIEFTSFEVDPEHLKTKPLEVLCHLGELILRDKRMPNIVYLGSEGLDNGGLRRQLVTTLLKTLLEKGSPLQLTESVENTRGVLPLLSDISNETQVFAFRILGALIALASLGSLPLGRVLVSNFYYSILSLTNKEIDSIDITKPLNEDLAKKIYLSALGLKEKDEDTFQGMQEMPCMVPIALAAKEFKSIVKEVNLEKFRKLELNKFVELVEGEEITWDNFTKKTVYKGDAGDVLKTKTYFESFFKEYEKNKPQKVEDMIELFTSSRSLGQEDIKIFIKKEKNKEDLFKVSTCFQQVTIPVYEDYETFKAKLFKTIEHTLGGFDEA